jgi:hypothetical protein
VAASISMLHFLATGTAAGRTKSNYGRYKSTLQGGAGLAPRDIIDRTLTNVGRRLGEAPTDGETVSNSALQKTTHTDIGTARGKVKLPP